MSQPQIDPRGQQFAAALTAVVLVVVLLTAPSPYGVALLAVQALLFAVGAVLGPQKGPWALVFRRVVRPRIGPPKETEDAAPPRFAQGVGLVFALVGLVGYLTGVTVLGAVAVGLALVAALLNAVFAFCLGCEMYLLIRRLLPATENATNKKEVTA
ncbi:MAG: hypothetical protein JWO46_2623 [Nocardioidaceae bacterium]|nr:hypothetical protein [Nocardioidaceae bacterium]